MSNQFWISIGAFQTALGIALSALGAHAFEKLLTQTEMEQLRTANQYIILNGIGTVLIALLRNQWNLPKKTAAFWFLLLGTLMFSGGIYSILFSGLKLHYIIPFGGVALISAWVFVGFSFIRKEVKE
jgi:uncharacterized membrane protein YgdD (TMEM256/DUF423 family)